MTEAVLERDPGTATPEVPSRASTLAFSPSQDTGATIDYERYGKILMDRCIADGKGNQARLDRDRQDMQNLLFYRGGKENHWSVYDKGTHQYVERGTDPEQGGVPDWVPRPAHNLLAVEIDGITSLLNQSEPAKSFYPSTDDDRDRAAAEVAEDADPVLLDEIGYDTKRPELNKLVTLTNGAALIVYFDNDEKYGISDIPLLRCPTCQVETLPKDLEEAGNVCPEEGCATAGEAFEPVIDARGVPQGVPFPTGRICAQVVPSFEYSLPSTARVADSARVPWVLTHSGMPDEDILSRWKDVEGLRETLSASGSRKSGGIQRSFARQMRNLSSPTRANAMAGADGKDDHVVYILQHDPIDERDERGEGIYFPYGFHGVLIEDLLAEAGPLPVTDDEGRAVKSVLIRQFAVAPGTPYGKPPCDDLVPLQVSRNLVDSLIQLILMHDAAPRSWIPLSVTLENKPTGRPGEDVYYRSSVPGEKPQTERGINPPDGLYKYLEMIDAKLHEVSKLNAVLAGQRPEGEPTLGEIEILQERGMAAFKEPFDAQVHFELQLTRLLMWIAKRSAWSPRFRQVRGDNGDWDVRQFTAADLDGKFDVQIEKTSAWPKSQVMRFMRTSKAIELGVLPPPAQDPELGAKMLVEMDLTHLKPSMNADRKQVARELDRWKAAHTSDEILPPNPATQELALHKHFKKQFLKTEEFEDLQAQNPELAQAMIAHVAQIDTLMQQEAMKQAQVQHPPPPAPPDGRTPVEKGDGSAVHAAVTSGALVPVGAQPAANPLSTAVSSGALLPAGAVPSAPGPSIDDLTATGVLLPAPSDVGGAPSGRA